MYVGYARVSTQDQTLDLQRDALEKVGCTHIFTDTISGATTERPGEEVYLKEHQSMVDAVSNLRTNFTFYNHERLHQALDDQTPAQVYFGH